MARSKDALVDVLGDVTHEQFVATMDKLEPYKNDKALYKAEVYKADSDLAKTSDNLGKWTVRRQQHTTALPNATFTQVGVVLDELTAVPTEPAPTQPIDPPI